MDFSKNFKAAWWCILIVCVGYYLASRFPQLQAGDPTWFDALAFIVWVAVALGPFFKEMELFGLKFKQEVEKLKEHVSTEMASIRTSIRSVTEQRQVASSSINLGYPPPVDSQLAHIKEQITIAVREAVGSTVETKQASAEARPPIPSDDVQYLFSARLAIENELRVINRPMISGIGAYRRFEPVNRIVESLVREERITADIGKAIREVYSVCSLAVHGEDVSPAKVDFVRSTAPQLLSALKVISARDA